MLRTHSHPAVRTHRATIKLALVTGLAMLLLAGTVVRSAVFAQQNPSPRTDSPGATESPQGMPLAEPQGRVPEAPVGHRQPRPQDLPPSVQRQEGGGASSGGVNADRLLDQQLQICKGC
jgi:hypothetical protein